MIKRNYKSDLILKLTLPTGQESEDFAIDFYTDGLKHIEVSRLSGIYKHCAVTDAEKPAIVTITLVNHGFGIGTLKYDLKTWAPNTATSDGDIATNVPVIEGSYELVLGAGDDQSEAEIQAAIDCIKAALEAQSAANEAMAAKVEADLATAKALTAASSVETAEAAIDTTLDNVVKSVDNNTTAVKGIGTQIAASLTPMETAVSNNTTSVDSLKAVQETIKTALDLYLPSVEWSRSVEVANGNSYGAVKFGNTASLFTKIPNLVFSDKDTMTDFSYMFIGCKNLQSVTTDELVAMFPMITSISGNCGSMFNGCQGLTSVSFSHDLSGNCGFMFNNCTGLTSVAFSHDLSGNLSGMFYGCTGLTTVSVTATMTQFPSLQWSTKLDKASAENIINHLADLTGKTKQTLNLSKTAITTDYGSTTADEWTTLVASATAKNWTVSLN